LLHLVLKNFHPEVDDLRRGNSLTRACRVSTKRPQRLDYLAGKIRSVGQEPKEKPSEHDVPANLRKQLTNVRLFDPHRDTCPGKRDADLRLTKRIASGARILQIKFLDQVIVGQAIAGRPGYFSFQEAGLL
jgi:RadC-like JAB domain